MPIRRAAHPEGSPYQGSLRPGPGRPGSSSERSGFLWRPDALVGLAGTAGFPRYVKTLGENYVARKNFAEKLRST